MDRAPVWFASVGSPLAPPCFRALGGLGSKELWVRRRRIESSSAGNIFAVFVESAGLTEETNMGGLSLPHLLLLGVVMLLLFGGKGKISDIMGDVAKGIKSFKKGLSDEEAAPAPAQPVEAPRTIDHQAPAAIDAARDPHKAG
jgi:sec-independent protein translocase protein TatA